MAGTAIGRVGVLEISRSGRGGLVGADAVFGDLVRVRVALGGFVELSRWAVDGGTGGIT